MEVVKRCNAVNNGTAIGQCIKAATQTRSGSLSYMRRITKATCEHILYSRTDIDRKVFKSMLINGKKYKVLRSRVDNCLLVDFKEMLDALLKLIDRDYVSEARMFFANKEDPRNPLESYVFKFIPEENEVYTNFDILRKFTIELRQSTTNMFDNIFCLDDNYEVLDHKAVGIYFTVTYRNGKHPRNIDTLIRCKRDDQEVGEMLIAKSAENFPHCYTMGKMNTGHHKMKINAKGKVYEPNAEQMEVVNYEAELPTEAEPQPEAEPKPKAELVACLCGVAMAYDKIDMLRCINCCTYQHGVCLGYRNHKEFPQWYMCATCSPNIRHSTAEVACIRLSIAMAHEYQAHPEGLFRVQPFAVRKSLYKWFTRNNFHKQIDNKFEINFNTINEELLEKIFNKP